MKRDILIFFVIGLFLTGCSKGGFSPGPKGDIGAQGDIGPSSIEGPSSENAIHIEDTGVLVEEEFPLRGFSEIEISDFFDVEIRQGETYHVMVAAEEALTPYLEVVIRGETLQVGLKSGYVFNFENASHRVEVTLPALTRARINNHSTMHLMDFDAGDILKLEAIDFSELNGAIDAKEIQVEVTNHSTLTLNGSASQVFGELTEFSSADLTQLDAAEVDIEIDDHSTLNQ